MIGFSPHTNADTIAINKSIASHLGSRIGSSSHGIKRLASSREELERSWQPIGFSDKSCVSSVVRSISYSVDSLDGDKAIWEDSGEKRRRTMEPEEMDTDTAVMFPQTLFLGNGSTFVTGLRVFRENRPPRSNYDCNGNYIIHSQPYEINSNTLDYVTKAGWYEGHVDASGNRHGKGITKHDDGTESEGFYVDDVMKGWGRYKFSTSYQSIPSKIDGSQGQFFLQRETARTFEGIFHNGQPSGKGTMITKIVDSLPRGMNVCSVSTGIDIQFIKVIFDVGMYREDWKPIGEGVRFTFSRSSTMTEWEESCTRLLGEECTGMKVARSYATWICDCLGMSSYPSAPFL